MFSDMANFSAISERDESLALALLREHNEVLRTQFAAFGGREIKSLGDGFLVEFPSALQAANCALAVQSDLARRNESSPEQRRFTVRIGIHIGDVVAEGGDLLGSGVNIAARIGAATPAGSVYVSEDVARQLRNQPDLVMESRGNPELKNIGSGTELFLLARSGGEETVAAPPAGSAARSQELSVAILPFANLSADPDNEYFSDGLTEDVITAVSRIRSIRVISRTSVMRYKNTGKGLREIARELGVSTLLEGSVRKVGNRVRITGQLIDGASDSHLWAESYDRELNDIFAIQAEVAEQIAKALKAQILPDERERLAQKPTSDSEAYEFLLKGRFFMAKRNEEGLKRALEYLNEAIKLDPAYAEAYAAVADCYALFALFELMPPKEAFPKALAAAKKALELNSELAEAHASLGLVQFQYNWNWEEAERHLKEATRLNPNYAPGHHFFADYLKAMGRFQQALLEIEHAQSLDPLSLAIASGVGHVLYLSRNYDEAIEAYKHVLELDGTFVQGHLWFGRPYLQKGMFEEAIAEIQQAVGLSGASTISLAVLAHALASAGRTEEANTILRQLMKRSASSYVPSYWIALVYVGFGDKAKALEWLEKAREERSSWLVWCGVEPRFDALRGEARFGELLRDIGLEH